MVLLGLISAASIERASLLLSITGITGMLVGCNLYAGRVGRFASLVHWWRGALFANLSIYIMRFVALPLGGLSPAEQAIELVLSNLANLLLFELGATLKRQMQWHRLALQDWRAGSSASGGYSARVLKLVLHGAMVSAPLGALLVGRRFPASAEVWGAAAIGLSTAYSAAALVYVGLQLGRYLQRSKKVVGTTFVLYGIYQGLYPCLPLLSGALGLAGPVAMGAFFAGAFAFKLGCTLLILTTSAEFARRTQLMVFSASPLVAKWARDAFADDATRMLSYNVNIAVAVQEDLPEKESWLEKLPRGLEPAGYVVHCVDMRARDHRRSRALEHIGLITESKYYAHVATNRVSKAGLVYIEMAMAQNMDILVLMKQGSMSVVVDKLEAGKSFLNLGSMFVEYNDVEEAVSVLREWVVKQTAFPLAKTTMARVAASQGR